MELSACKVSIIKFVCDPIKDESINIGLILHCSKNRYIDCKFSETKLQKIKILNPEINIKFLDSVITDFESKYSSNNAGDFSYFSSEISDPSFLDRLAKTHSNQLRVSVPKGVLVEDYMLDMDKFFNQYVGEDAKQKRKTVVRDVTIKSTLKKEFRNRELLDKVVYNDVEVTGKFGEPISLDFKYLNGKINYIHSLSFDTEDKNINDAKLWMMNYNEIKEVYKNKVGITTVYCPPSQTDRLKEFEKSLKVLKASNTELVDYTNGGQIVKLLEHVLKTAHN